ncbi:MAG: MarR family transcriptional regulator [Methylobacteriaceae bacterium]|nr:MarR family transcriptional regulator [Methylobacteriaceae bacterium]
MPPEAAPDAVRVWFRLLRLETAIRAAMAERLREVGLSVPQCDVLTTLTEQEGVSQQDLAERLYVTKGNISGLIDRLVVAGLVERRALPNDRRSHAIVLTAAGRKAAEAGIALQREFVAETLGRLSPADLVAFEAHLVKARDLVRAVGAAPAPKAQPAARKRSTRSGRPAMSSRT